MKLGATISLKDRYTTTLKNAYKATGNLNKRVNETTKSLKTFGKTKVAPVVKIKDQASRKIGEISAKAKILGRLVLTPVVKVKDMMSSVLSRIKSSLLSLHGLAAITLAFVGVSKLSDSTVGAAMNFQKQEISMEHWLKGNLKLAQEATRWLEKFAAATPFEMTDLFPAMTRAIGITNGDLNISKRLVKLATNMAALTPGKTIQDAMEALADAQMGEFERLKEFNMKVTQEQYKAMGGFTGMISKAERTFSGGADKLSQSAAGLLSTITDNINTFFRKTGEGILKSMMPRLKRITTWFAKHPKTVEKWKNELIKFGNQAGEFVFSRLEKAFDHVRKNYLDNPDFKKLTFAGKINFIMDDISKGFQNWLNNGGADRIKDFGSTVGGLIGDGIKQVAPELGKTAADAMVTAFAAGLQSSPLGAILFGALGGAAIGSVVPGVGTLAGAAIGGASGLVTWGTTKVLGVDSSNKTVKSSTSKPAGASFSSHYSNPSLSSMFPGRAMGLPYVPYDNYLASLHKGESVLTRAEADQYRKGSGYVVIQKIADSVVIREEADIDRLARAFAAQLKGAHLNYGGA